MKIRVSLLVLVLVLLSSLHGISDEAGTTGFNSLKIMYSARSNSMAGAFTSLDDDIDGVFFNPASIAKYGNKRELSTTFMNYFEGYSGGSLVYQLKKSEKGNFAFFTQYLTSGDITRTKESDNGGYYEDGTFNSTDMLVGLTYAHYFNKEVSLGFNAKYLNESIDGNNASALALDVGLLHRPQNDRIRVGASIKNLGTQLTYFSDSEYDETLPLTYSGGISYRFDLKNGNSESDFKPTMLVSLDITLPKGSDFIGLVGTELKVHEQFFLRFGYKTNSSDWKTGGDFEGLSGLSTGVGFIRKSLKIDYSINSYGDLGFVNQVSLKYLF
ncbi:MAG: hypothetical protein B6226_00620 [Candidatus Cloacimonetes bacterium 4572_65]|nr:MAG: hypothetical protein B6226_00620 [Candidatus Cloacimonetes bacterium 4572_65]